jgi:hypothetical protein
MEGNPRFPALAELQSRLTPLLQDVVSEEIAIAMIRSLPLVGSALSIDRNTLGQLSALFDGDTEIQRDIDKVIQNMSETEEIMCRLNAHIESRKHDLQQTLDEYNRFKDLAAVEREKAQPLLNELRREGNTGIIWGVLTNALMVALGIVLSHFLRIWFPGFSF